MSTIVIACETIKDEVLLAVERTNSTFPIVWIESGLHENPENLNKRLQKEIVKLDGQYEYILLGYGYCGTALKGLFGQTSKLVIPKVEDCISLMLGGDEERIIVNNKDKPLFMTRGWLHYCSNMKDFSRCVEKYGYEKTCQIYRRIYSGYEHIDLIDTGAYNISGCLKQAQEMASRYDLKCKTIPGSLRILYNAFSGTWDDDFAVIEPEQPVTPEALGKAIS